MTRAPTAWKWTAPAAFTSLHALACKCATKAGRVNCILPTPNGKSSNVVLGGADGDTLFVTAGDKVYKRKVKPKAAPSFAEPIKPAAPKL